MELKPNFNWLAFAVAPFAEEAEQMLSQYGMRLSGAVRADIGRSLQSPKLAVRLMAAIRMEMHLAHGVDTASACGLGDGLLRLLENHWLFLRTSLRPNPATTFATLLSSWIYASKEEGHLGALLSRWLSAAQVEPNLREEHVYWNAGCYVAIAHLRSNDLKVVDTFLEEFPEEMAPMAPQLTVLRGQHAAFSRGRFQLDAKRTTEEEARAIWERDLEVNALTLARLCDEAKTKAAAALGWDTSKLPALVAELRSQREFAMADVSFDDKYRHLSRRALEWRRDLRDFLSPGRDTQHVNKEWVEDCLSHVSLVQAGAIDATELEDVTVAILSDLGRSLRWARRAADQHTIWMLRWCAVTVYEKRGDVVRTLRSLHRLGSSLNAKRLKTNDPNVCSLVAHYFSGFAEKVAKLQASRSRPDLMMAAFELRRGRALIAARADLELNGQGIWSRLQPLGKATHYLGFTVFHEQRKVFAQLVSADGRLSIHPLTTEWADLQAAVGSLEPLQRERRSRFLAPSPPQWLRLSSLLGPLDEAMISGRINVGDHVCIAADDPIHLLPLHALPCGGQPMFRLLSSSRVASFSDAAKLANEQFRRPNHATALLVNARHKDPSLRRRHFGQTVEKLRALGLDVDAVSPDFLTADELLGHLARGRIIHVHAHGHFPPGTNPQTHCGIVVSDGLGPPILDGAVCRLLTPEAILASDIELAGAHLTLSTCVSGKGLPGRFGDALGLEMALRLSGASSLLATHWNVRSDDATVFCDHFYSAWIRDGQSRARAWQLAILALADQGAPIDVQAHWCAFSLFGGWT